MGFYANALNVTVKRLNLLTIFYIDRTVWELADEWLLTEAMLLLKFTSKSAKVIAYELNFYDPVYFFRWFKSIKGATEKEYRRGMVSDK